MSISIRKMPLFSISSTADDGRVASICHTWIEYGYKSIIIIILSLSIMFSFLIGCLYLVSFSLMFVFLWLIWFSVILWESLMYIFFLNYNRKKGKKRSTISDYQFPFIYWNILLFPNTGYEDSGHYWTMKPQKNIQKCL